MSAPVRGQIFWADIGYGAKPWVIVSNNLRNRVLSDVLAVRITTTNKRAALPTWIPLDKDDPLVGYINTDDLQQLDRAELGERLGAVGPKTMLKINDALQIVLAIP